MKKDIFMIWISIISLSVSFVGYGCKTKPTEPEKIVTHEVDSEIPETEGKENWAITIPESKILQTDQRFHYILGRVENGIVQVVEKNSGDQSEKDLLAYHNGTQTNDLLSLALSSDGKYFAYFSEKGLVTYDREKQTERILEENSASNVKLKGDLFYSYYIKNIQWSYDNRYLLTQYVGFEASTIFVFDHTKKKKMTPSGKGLVCGFRMHWSPKEVRFVDASSDFAYGNPGLYLSEKNTCKRYREISTSIGLKDYLFYQAVFSPQGDDIAFISSAKAADFETMSADAAHLKLWLYPIDQAPLEEVYRGELQNTLFYHPTGEKLYYVVRETGKTTIMAYEPLNKIHQKVVTILSGTFDIQNVLWLDHDKIVMEIVNMNSDNSFKNTRVICLDLNKQQINYASSSYPYEIKLLKVF